MRISLLQKREPLGRIVEETLSDFWTEAFGIPYELKWTDGIAALRRRRRHLGQKWNCNQYINSIFIPEIDQAAFGPIRQEFRRSQIPWKRPLQRAYVWMACHPLLGSILAGASMEVSPAVPNADSQLIVPGNHKIRILDHRLGLAYSILKSGFDGRFMIRELEAREQLGMSDLPVPKIREIGAKKNWFSEDYISGTPINRLVDRRFAKTVELQAIDSISRLAHATTIEISQSTYVLKSASEACRLLSQNHLLSDEEKMLWMKVIGSLVSRMEPHWMKSERTMRTSLSHGDFQSGNILVEQDRFWLIDWEYSSRRQFGYDLLVIALRSRSSKGLASRLMNFVEKGLDPEFQGKFSTDVFVTKAEREWSVSLFLLEEILLHLEENDNPRFLRIGDGLIAVFKEAEHWVRGQ